MTTSTTWIDLTGPARAAVRTRHLRYWVSVVGLALADALSFVIAQAALRHGDTVPTIAIFLGRAGTSATPHDVFGFLAAIFILIRYLSGDYGRRQLFWDGARVTTVALIFTAMPDIFMVMLGMEVYAVTPVLLSWLLLLFLVPIMRQLARLLMARMGLWQIPTALIGISHRAAEIRAAVSGPIALGFDVRWVVIEDSTVAPPESLRDLKQIHSSDPDHIAALVCSEGCKEAIITAEDMQSTHLTEVVQRLLEVNVPVAIVPSINRLPLANATTHYFFGSDILMMQLRSNVQRLPSRFLKRLFDVFTSTLLLVLLTPLFLLIAIAIKRANPGPVTYSQTRIGRYGAPFECIKFRTMVIDADAHMARWAQENPELHQEFLKTFKLREDPRVTRIGAWLRKTSLDELPQLWNVIRGDMSLVGPRPVVALELTNYYGPAAQVYMRARPGITGLWQVSGRSNTSYERRVFLDEWYILNWSFWYDIVILIRTAWIVLSGKGAF